MHTFQPGPVAAGSVQPLAGSGSAASTEPPYVES